MSDQACWVSVSLYASVVARIVVVAGFSATKVRSWGLDMGADRHVVVLRLNTWSAMEKMLDPSHDDD